MVIKRYGYNIAEKRLCRTLHQSKPARNNPQSKLTNVNHRWYLMQHNNAYYSKKKIRSLIENGAVHITEWAIETAKKHFGWGYDSICNAILKIPTSCCYKRDVRYDSPKIWVDYYRANNIMGENIYTHFYIEDETLIIDSFKELNDEVL
jgi:hypothetical protein